MSAYPFWSFRTESVADSHPRCHSVARKLKERRCLEGIQTQLTSSQIEHDRRENWRQAWTIKREDGSGWPTVRRRILSRKCLTPHLSPEFLLLLFSQAFFLPFLRTSGCPFGCTVHCTFHVCFHPTHFPESLACNKTAAALSSSSPLPFH